MKGDERAVGRETGENTEDVVPHHHKRGGKKARGSILGLDLDLEIEKRILKSIENDVN